MSNQMVPYEVNGVSVVGTEAGVFNDAQKQLLRDTICKGASDDEFDMFLQVCRVTKLSPFGLQQIHAVKRRAKDADGNWREALTFQIGINGLALLAERTGKYLGTAGPYWCGEDGLWREVWLSETPPAAAKAGVWKRGAREPVWMVATWREWVQTYTNQKTRQEELAGLWAQKPSYMLAKCATAAAFRRAFPAELAGYEIAVDDEPQPDYPPARISDLYPEEPRAIAAPAPPPTKPAPPEDSPPQEPPSSIADPDTMLDWTPFWLEMRRWRMDWTEVHRYFGLEEKRGELAKYAAERALSVREVYRRLCDLVAIEQHRQQSDERQPSPDDCPLCGETNCMTEGTCQRCGHEFAPAQAAGESTELQEGLDLGDAWEQQTALARTDPADVRPKAGARR